MTNDIKKRYFAKYSLHFDKKRKTYLSTFAQLLKLIQISNYYIRQMKIGQFFWGLSFVALAIFSSGCEKDEIETESGSSSGSKETDLSDITFDRTVTVAFSTNGDATVSGTSDDFAVTISGNDVTIVNNGSDIVKYELSGKTTDGFFKLYSSKTQAIVLNGANITNANGAAINIQGPQSKPSGGKCCYIVTQSESTLCDGSSYTDTPTDEDEKGVLFSEGALIFSGGSTINVKATGKSGIVSDDYVHFNTGADIDITSSAGHGVKANDYILVSDGTINVSVSANMKKGFSSDSLVMIEGGNTTINITGSAAYDSEDNDYTGTAGIKADATFTMSDGNLTITNSGKGGKGINGNNNAIFNGGTVKITVTGSNYTSGSNSVAAKGIKFDGNITFNGGNIVVNCTSHEGIEAKGTITVNDGEIYSYSASDDAINSGSTFTISGGYVFAYAPSNDGMDANGNFYLKGGVIYAIGSTSPEVAIDANTESNYNLYVQGGTLIAIGGLEQGSSLSQSCYQASSWSGNTWYALTVGSTTYAFKTPATSSQSDSRALVVSGSSTPTLKSNVTVSGGTSHFEGMMYTGATISGSTTVSLSSYTGGGSGPGGGGPGGGGPGGGF